MTDIQAHNRFKGIRTTTGEDVIVVFRHIMNETGEVVDPHHCIVYNPEMVEYPYTHELASFLDSQAGQQGEDLWANLFNERFADGTIMLETLDNMVGLLNKAPTQEIQLMPGTKFECLLSELNAALEVTSSGQNAYEEQVAQEHALLEPELTRPPKEEAEYLLAEARQFFATAEENLRKAEALSPGCTRNFNAPAKPNIPTSNTEAAAAAVQGATVAAGKVKIPQVKGGVRKVAKPPASPPAKKAAPKKAVRRKSTGSVKKTSTRKPTKKTTAKK